MELFPNFGISESERLYIIGNGFDLHHWIESGYSDFENWLRKNKNTRLVGLMDIFFSHKREFRMSGDSICRGTDPDTQDGAYGCQVPKGVWHTVEVIEPSVIYEGKDGKYGEDGSETY